MAKIRVYELARELKMESKVLLAKMKEMGIQVPSHQSTLTSAQIEKVRVQLQASQPTKVVVRRRRKSAESASDSASQESSSASITGSAASSDRMNNKGLRPKLGAVFDTIRTTELAPR